MPNIVLRPYPHPSAYRRIAAVAWADPTDPHVYGSMEVRAEPVERWIADLRARTGQRVTLTHAMVRALALIYRRHPEINAIVRHGSLQLREDVDIFVQVVVEDSEPPPPGEGGKKGIGSTDLSGVKIKRADQLKAEEICQQITERAARIRKNEDAEFKATKDNTRMIPGFLLGPVLRFLDFLQYSLNVNPSFLGTPADPFGSAMVTNVGVFGLTRGWAPFFPLARSGVIVTLGAIEERPVVEDGKIVVGRVLHINGTFDHRIVDGYHAGVIARELRRLFASPELLEQDP